MEEIFKLKFISSLYDVPNLRYTWTKEEKIKWLILKSRPVAPNV